MNEPDSITIRQARSADGEALDRLAGLDSKALPSDDFLIAEVAGDPWAAVGVRSGVVVADPFRPSGGLAELLCLRAKRVRQSRTTAGPRPPVLQRLVAATATGRRPAIGGEPCCDAPRA